jgi:hypothetical protein
MMRLVIVVVAMIGCGESGTDSCTSQERELQQTAATSGGCNQDSDCVVLQSLDYDCAGLCGAVVNRSAKPKLDTLVASLAADCNLGPCGVCPVVSVSVGCVNNSCVCKDAICS